MRNPLPEKIETGRVRTGDLRSNPSNGGNGAFFVFGPCGEKLKIIASDGTSSDADAWEHVSISTRRRVPNWQEMCFVKDLFWNDEECVVQFHPPKSEYINNHPYCLHLWRPLDRQMPMPPSILVGLKGVGEQEAREMVDNGSAAFAFIKPSRGPSFATLLGKMK